jgi:hypothetical protein
MDIKFHLRGEGACFMLISTLNMDAICSFATAVNFHLTAWCHVPETVTLPRKTSVFKPTFLILKTKIEVGL